MGVARSRRSELLAGSLVLLVLLPVCVVALARALPALHARLAPPAASPAGWWQRFRNEADGYALALPPGWQVLTLEAGGPAQGGAAALAERLAGWARERTGTGQGLWAAAAPDGALGSTTTVNIIRQPLGSEMPVEAFARASLDTLRKSGQVAIGGQDWLNLSAGRALRVQLTYPLNGVSLAITQVYLVNGANGYVFTAVCRSEQAATYAPMFEGIVRSLRWTA